MNTAPSTTGREGRHGRRGQGGLLFPLLIICAGVVLLLNNIGVTDWSGWDLVVRLWPVLIIVTGLDLALGRDGILTPILLCAVGVAALLCTTGVWQWDIVGVATRYWPVLLIAIGVDVFVSKPRSVGALIGVLPGVVFVAALAWFLGSVGNSAAIAEIRTISQAMPAAASSADVSISPIGGSLRVTALRDEGLLVAGSVGLTRDERIEESLSTSGGTATYVLASQGSYVQPTYARDDDRQWYWDVQVTPDLPLGLSTSIVAGQTHLDLSGLDVRQFDSETVFGESYFLLPSGTALSGRIEGVAGKIVIVVPAATALRLEVSNLAGDVDVPADFVRQGDDYYTTPGYDSASSRATITVDQVFGEVEVRYEKG